MRDATVDASGIADLITEQTLTYQKSVRRVVQGEFASLGPNRFERDPSYRLSNEWAGKFGGKEKTQAKKVGSIPSQPATVVHRRDVSFQIQN